jgi:hypothetical protein
MREFLSQSTTLWEVDGDGFQHIEPQSKHPVTDNEDLNPMPLGSLPIRLLNHLKPNIDTDFQVEGMRSNSSSLM